MRRGAGGGAVDVEAASSRLEYARGQLQHRSLTDCYTLLCKALSHRHTHTRTQNTQSNPRNRQCTDDSNYVGEYARGKRQGYGVYSFPNGDMYSGEYEDDLPQVIKQ